jgi:methylphosphotriester-DNA--protein-cysteine methyltransferase
MQSAVGAMTVVDFSVSCGVQLRTSVAKERLLIGFAPTVSDTVLIERGQRYSSDEFIAVSGDDLLFVSLGPTTMRWIEIDLGLLAPGRQVHALPESPINALVKPSLAHAIVMADYARSALDAASYVNDRDAASAALEILSRARAIPGTPAEKRRLSLVERVEELVWKNIEEPQTLGELCASLECKARTLIYTFKSVVGLSPMKYFKVRRLNAVRRKLVATGGKKHVFRVAADCGFWHMGHFDAAYKEMFGVTPRETSDLLTLAKLRFRPESRNSREVRV